MMHDFEPAADAREQLRRWDAGGTVWSIEMGGLGPGYEQAIQVLAIEIVRDNLDKPLPRSFTNWGHDTAGRIDVKLPNGIYSCGGFSGAQVGAAQSLAFKWLTIGPAALLQEVKKEPRHIQVSAFWPRAPKQEDLTSSGSSV